MDSTINGETEVFLGQKIDLLDGQEMTLEKFDQIVEYPPALAPFFVLLSDILYKIVNAPKKGPWRVPPVRIFNKIPPRIIVPASLEKRVDGNYCFEFFVTEPPPYTEKVTISEYASLYNLFIVSWSFRWRVIESHLKELKRKKNTKSLDEKEKIRKQNKLKNELNELYLDMKRITLDSYNRRIENEVDVIDIFSGEENEIMKTIVDPESGLWFKIYPKFYDAIDAERNSLNGEHVGEIMKYLEIWRDLSKTTMILTLKGLLKFTEDKKILKGKLVSATATLESLLNN
jgi:hypothetical protein